MTSSDQIAIAAGIIGIVLAVIGFLLRLVWSSLVTKLTAIEAKLDKHVEADVAAHERIKGAEVRLDETKEKLTEVDGRRHRYQTFNDEAIRDMHRWITERVIEALKR